MAENETTTKEFAEKRNSLEYLGDSFIELGTALKNQESTFLDLCHLANKCGLNMQFRIVEKE